MKGITNAQKQPDLTNYVDLTSLQTITGTKAFSVIRTNIVLPRNVTGDNLGSSTYKWQNLYLRGNLTDGTNSISVANIVAKSELINLIYPVGSIYMSVNNVSPATFLGGTWTQIKDTFLLSAGDTYTAGSTGGEATHTLSISEMPSHDHNFKFIPTNIGTGGIQPDGSTIQKGYSGSASSSVTTIYTMQAQGGNGAHNNMPPYLTVYMWKRTA